MHFLNVDKLSVRFDQAAVVEDLSFHVDVGETVAIVGESGCGKSVTALALSRLLDANARVSGSVTLDGTNLSSLSERNMRAVRGRDIGFVFQDPMSSLNPVLTIGEQVSEAVEAHSSLGRRVIRARVLELLDLVHIPDGERRLGEYPHRFSGGMRQRVAIAIAIASSPRLLIADEPTTALDVTIQAQILQLLKELQRRLGMALILITHDLGVVAETADRVLVMYAGRKVEERRVEELFSQPRHPYTRQLMASKPRFRAAAGDGRPPRLQEIPGLVPLPGTVTKGCAFASRCYLSDDLCSRDRPALRTVSQGMAACHHSEHVKAPEDLDIMIRPPLMDTVPGRLFSIHGSRV